MKETAEIKKYCTKIYKLHSPEMSSEIQPEMSLRRNFRLNKRGMR